MNGLKSRDAARRLAWIVVVSLAVKVAFLPVVADMECTGDQCSFLHAARAVLAGDGFDYGTDDWSEGHTPPLFVLFLAGLLGLSGGSLSAVRFAQVVVSCGTVVLVFHLARRWVSPRGALLASAGVAIYPNFIAYTQYAFTETVFSCLLAALVLSLVRLQERGRIRDAVLIGALFGIAALFRSMVLYLLLPVGAWVLFGARREGWRALVRAAVIVFVMLTVISPWAAYNRARFGKSLLLATNAGNVVYRNLNHFPPENYDYRAFRRTEWRPDQRPWVRSRAENPVDRYQEDIRAGMTFALENPATTARYAWIKLRGLWNPGSFLLRYLHSGVYGEVNAGMIALWTVLAVGSFMLAVLAGTLGIAGARAGPLRVAVLLVIAYWLAIHGMTLGMSRYRLPLMVFFLLGAGAFLDDPRGCLRRLRGRPLTMAALVPWGILLVSSWLLYAPILWGGDRAG
ncbi:MAG: glycosyltransferase family 39 protein [Gemmatimonadota bacterium]|jgi:4-amino-4-deoxy-L-arabinose transferase-like glycosyltransferase|nr:glycosyltransferase family 39 protein [Gemmatimonadota bacterium]MDP6801740.1 glycosyltransferase family 39 protein [Gemmatimonadota bacterium]MDP7031184.1 glycosyltransferase family 39 protein [Gemmatimonadota bacterium]